MRVNVIQSVLKANDAVAAANRARLCQTGVLGLNLMSAPGSGKTSLLERTIGVLGHAHGCGVLAADLQTTRDAERLASLTTEIVQINTGTGCHLLATQVSEALDTMPLDRLDFLFIENVGNMVCPAAFDLGEQRKVALLSVTEGDDKVAKYPTLFQQADVILITKIDLLHAVDFDRGRVDADLCRINTHAPVIALSSRTGENFEAWIHWLITWLSESSPPLRAVRLESVPSASPQTALYLG